MNEKRKENNNKKITLLFSDFIFFIFSHSFCRMMNFLYSVLSLFSFRQSVSHTTCCVLCFMQLWGLLLLPTTTQLPQSVRPSHVPDSVFCCAHMRGCGTNQKRTNKSQGEEEKESGDSELAQKKRRNRSVSSNNNNNNNYKIAKQHVEATRNSLRAVAVLGGRVSNARCVRSRICPHAEVHVRMVQKGGVKSLIQLRALCRPRSPALLALAIGNIASTAENRVPIVDEGALGPLITYVRNEDGDVIGRQYSALALGNLASKLKITRKL